MWSPEDTGTLDIASTVPRSHSGDQKIDNDVALLVSSTKEPLDDFTKFILRGCQLKAEERRSKEPDSGFCGDM